MSKDRIVAIYKVKGIRVKNHNHNIISKEQEFIYVEYADGSIRYIDPTGRLDITDVNYLEVDESKKKKIKAKDFIFEEYSIERRGNK